MLKNVKKFEILCKIIGLKSVYTDANGRFVIVLTQDTSENRATICKELGRSESNTTFVTGNHTLAYLTELQEKITNAMINKEIPWDRIIGDGMW